MLLFALCCLPCSVAGGVVHMQKIENSLVFVGRKPYAPCSGNARSNQLSVGTRNKYRWKKELKKRTHGTRKQGQKRAFLRPKWLPKWTPEASRNVCTRWSATESAKNASWGAPRAPPDDFGAIFLPHRYPGIIRALSKHPNFAHLGPWERTIIKEIDLKQLKHRIRHASGRWPGEF